MRATWKPHEKHGELTERADLPDSVFAYPKERKEPMTDASHVRNAIARFNQVEDVSGAEHAQAFANIKKAANHYGINLAEHNWRDLKPPARKKSTRKKTAAKKSTRKATPAKKGTAKKKTPTRKRAATKTKSPRKKSPVKRSPAKKTTRKTSAKKTTTKRSPTKRKTARKKSR